MFRNWKFLLAALVVVFIVAKSTLSSQAQSVQGRDLDKPQAGPVKLVVHLTEPVSSEYGGVLGFKASAADGTNISIDFGKNPISTLYQQVGTANWIEVTGIWQSPGKLRVRRISENVRVSAPPVAPTDDDKPYTQEELNRSSQVGTGLSAPTPTVASATDSDEPVTQLSVPHSAVPESAGYHTYQIQQIREAQQQGNRVTMSVDTDQGRKVINADKSLWDQIHSGLTTVTGYDGPEGFNASMVRQ
jgi:hypothetical protein